MKVIPLMTTSLPGLILALVLSSTVCSISPSSGSSGLIDGTSALSATIEAERVLAVGSSIGRALVEVVGMAVALFSVLLLLLSTSLRCTLLCAGCCATAAGPDWLVLAAADDDEEEEEAVDGVQTLFPCCLALVDAPLPLPRPPLAPPPPRWYWPRDDPPLPPLPR